MEDVTPEITSGGATGDVLWAASCRSSPPAYTATVTDNCGTPTLTQSPAAGTVLSGHNTTQLVTLTATDAAGNARDRKSVVKGKSEDPGGRRIIKKKKSVSAGASSCCTIVNWTIPWAVDYCSLGS